ncbi:unnamed protein product, partial [Prunus brigantina]
QLRNRRRTGSEGQLMGIGARMDGSSAERFAQTTHLGSVEKPKAFGSGRTTKGYRGPHGRFKHQKKKKITDTLDQLRNRRRTGPEGQLRGIGVHLGSVSKEKPISMGPPDLPKPKTKRAP